MNVVLLSGGLDSLVCLGTVLTEVPPEHVLALTIDYGQRHRKEVEVAKRLADKLGVSHVVYSLDPVIFTGSSLVGQDGQIPRASYRTLRHSTPLEVPFRNAVFVSIATALCLSRGGGEVYAGIHLGDAPYPDTSPEFCQDLAATVKRGTGGRVSLNLPLLYMYKTRIVERGRDLGLPLDDSWSCYEGGEVPCGACPTCREREEASGGVCGCTTPEGPPDTAG